MHCLHHSLYSVIWSHFTYISMLHKQQLLNSLFYSFFVFHTLLCERFRTKTLSNASMFYTYFITCTLRVCTKFILLFILNNYYTCVPLYVRLHHSLVYAHLMCFIAQPINHILRSGCGVKALWFAAIATPYLDSRRVTVCVHNHQQP